MAAVPEAPQTLAELLAMLAPELVNERRPTWHDRAACVGSSVDFFSVKPADVTAARAICAGCRVQPQCAVYGRDERDGVWGATSPASRALERRRAG